MIITDRRHDFGMPMPTVEIDEPVGILWRGLAFESVRLQTVTSAMHPVQLTYK